MCTTYLVSTTSTTYITSTTYTIYDIYHLYDLGVYAEGDHDEGIKRCREWCYSDIDCEYWQYDPKGCYVDAPAWEGQPPQYPLTMPGGSSEKDEVEILANDHPVARGLVVVNGTSIGVEISDLMRRIGAG